MSVEIAWSSEHANSRTVATSPDRNNTCTAATCLSFPLAIQNPCSPGLSKTLILMLLSNVCFIHWIAAKKSLRPPLMSVWDKSSLRQFNVTSTGGALPPVPTSAPLTLNSLRSLVRTRQFRVLRLSTPPPPNLNSPSVSDYPGAISEDGYSPGRRIPLIQYQIFADCVHPAPSSIDLILL